MTPLITALCVGVCYTGTTEIKPRNFVEVRKEHSVIPDREPDVVSSRASLEDYYDYNEETGEWVWRE